MARPREFESETALKKAIGAFSEHGYEGTSTDVLLQAMGISRQSMYGAFGDKKRLYLEALQHYTADSISNQLRALSSVSSPVKGLEAMLDLAVSLAIADPQPKCLGISAICEFGRSDPEVTMITDMASRTMLFGLERRISEARASGEISKRVDAQIAAQFIMATLAGIKIAARAGATAESLRGIARMAIRGLK
jgi:TetR/AcrR family transcriptional regulator, transcriptional repressor for nem operon